MSHNHKRFSALVVPALLGLSTMGVSMNISQADTTGPLRCEIQAASASGMIALQGIVFADVSVTGSYLFRVVSAGGGGSSNIQQGGAFSAGPHGPVTVGQISLGGSQAAYDAILTVSANGKTIECAGRIAI
jgi:hypothetical protein